MADTSGETEKVVATLKAYLKLCSKSVHRSVILKDTTFLGLLTSLLSNENPQIMTYIVKILLSLTERKEDAVLLTAVPGMDASIGQAAERPFPPTIAHNLLIISSRIRTAKTQQMPPSSAAGDSGIVGLGGGQVSDGGTLRRKFVARKSKQIVFEFEELSEDLKIEVERSLLAKKGVISVYFIVSDKRVIMRTILSMDVQDMAGILFDCGCEMVTHVVRIDGQDEMFTMLASERKEKPAVGLPDYIDEMEVADPKSCMVTNDFAKSQSGGGWFNSISSLVRGSLW